MRLANLPWPKAEAYFSQSDLVILAVGSIECHGRHLPLGTDTLVPDRLLEMIEARRSGVLIAPTIPYGSCDYFMEYPGTVDLGDDLLYRVLARVADCLYAHGARHFVILNGHGGNARAINQVGYDLYRRGGLLAALHWWKMVWDMNPAWKGGHGGGEETAAIMAIDPAMVDAGELYHALSLRPVSDDIEATHFTAAAYKGVSIEIPRPTWAVTDNGWIGKDHPQTATEAWGKAMLTTCADYIVDFLSAFARAPLPSAEESRATANPMP